MQYRPMNHDTFDKLIAALLLDEKHGLLLQRNHDERRLPGNPPGQKKTPPEVHYGDSGGRGRRGKSKSTKGKKDWKQKAAKRRVRGKGKGPHESKPSGSNDECHKCGLRGHWANKCRTPVFHCKLFQQSKGSGANDEGGSRTKTPSGQKGTFTTDFSDDSDAESHCVETDVESYSNVAADKAMYCLIDCATTHVILTDKRLFVTLEVSETPNSIKTVGGTVSIARGTGKAQVSLPNGTVIDIENAIYAPTSSRNLLSFADLRKNGLHVTTATAPDGKECLQLLDSSERIVEVCEDNGNGLYFTHITPTSLCDTFHSANGSDPVSPSVNQDKFSFWHDKLGHPGRELLKKMTKVVQGIPLTSADMAQHGERRCPPCAMDKLQSRKKTGYSGEKFKPRETLKMLVSDVCGPISPPSGPFNYCMIVKDSSSRYSTVQLLKSRNEVMPKLLTSIIQLKAQFPDHPIKSMPVDNAAEYVSKSFHEFCASSGITLETSVPPCSQHESGELREADSTGCETIASACQSPAIVLGACCSTCWRLDPLPAFGWKRSIAV